MQFYILAICHACCFSCTLIDSRLELIIRLQQELSDLDRLQVNTPLRL